MPGAAAPSKLPSMSAMPLMAEFNTCHLNSSTCRTYKKFTTKFMQFHMWIIDPTHPASSRAELEAA